MNVFAGSSRRQVGGGIWSTIKRGVKPVLSNLYSHLKPFGNAVAKRAVDFGASTAQDVISGKFNKNNFKNALNDEVNKIKNEGISTLKRKYLDAPQNGNGNKRRKVSNKSKKMPKSKTVSKRKVVRKSTKKQKTKQKPTKKTINKGRIGKKTKQKRRTVSRKALKDIFG